MEIPGSFALLLMLVKENEHLRYWFLRQAGIKEQTRKLFEVCRLRDVPIIPFVNNLDRDGRDPFDLLDEIEQGSALDVTPASWPIGIGRDFLGTYDLFADGLLLFEHGVHDRVTEPVRCNGCGSRRIAFNATFDAAQFGCRKARARAQRVSKPLAIRAP
jgi:peptide subunit release factor RF-3